MRKVLSLIICAVMLVGTVLPMNAAGESSKNYSADSAENASVTVETKSNEEVASIKDVPAIDVYTPVTSSNVSASIAAVSSSDENTAVITCSVSQNEMYRGDVFAVNVSLSDCGEIKAIQIDLSNINPDYFEIVSTEASAKLSGGIGRYNPTTCKFNYAFIVSTPISGDVFSFTLKVKEKAVFGNAEVGISSIVKVKLDGGSETSINTINIPANVMIVCAHNWMAVNTVAPTCISDGYTDYSCPICGATKRDDFVTDPNAHNWSLIETIDYTCTENGYSVYKCKACGTEKTDDVVPAAHRYEETVFEASPAAKRGFTLFTCSMCGDSYKDNFTYYVENTRAKAYVETVYGCAGDTVEVSVYVEDAGDLKTLAIDNLQYDESKLELVGGKWCIDNAAINDWNAEKMTGVLAFMKDTPVSGKIFTFTFKLNNDVIDYETVVSCTVTAKVKPAGSAETSIDVDNYSGKVWVSVYGDVSGDLEIDADDAILLLYHTIDEDNYDYEINQKGDFNGDGYVDSDDAIYLLYHTLLPELYPLNK